MRLNDNSKVQPFESESMSWSFLCIRVFGEEYKKHISAPFLFPVPLWQEMFSLCIHPAVASKAFEEQF